jgi:hypothetical protein
MKENFELFESLHPNKKLLFAFDNSMSHHKRAPDGLDAHLLPLKNDGKNAPMMRSTTFTDINNNVVEQSMQINGRPKGLKTILQESGKWLPNMLRESAKLVFRKFSMENKDNKYMEKCTQLNIQYLLLNVVLFSIVYPKNQILKINENG